MSTPSTPSTTSAEPPSFAEEIASRARKPAAVSATAPPAPRPPVSSKSQPRRATPGMVRAPGNGAGEASLSERDGSGKIFFDFNPEMISVSHTAPTDPNAGTKMTKKEGAGGQEGAGGGTNFILTAEEAVRAAGTTQIVINNIMFDGRNVKQTCDQLLDWTHPVPMATGQKQRVKTGLTILKFTWGSLVIIATLNSVSISYTRFSSQGTPTRAKVNLTFHQNSVQRKLTNPSSGGMPDRRTHVVTSGERLPTIATASYGGPGNWRPLAEVNRIDDPLRVRPGTVLYLPGRGELTRWNADQP